MQSFKDSDCGSDDPSQNNPSQNNHGQNNHNQNNPGKNNPPHSSDDQCTNSDEYRSIKIITLNGKMDSMDMQLGCIACTVTSNFDKFTEIITALSYIFGIDVTFHEVYKVIKAIDFSDAATSNGSTSCPDDFFTKF